MGSVPAESKTDMSAWADSGFQSFLEVIPEAILVSNRAGQIVLANAQAERLFGYSREALVGSLVEELVPPRLHEMCRMERDSFFADQRIPRPTAVQEVCVLRADQTEFPVEIRVSALQLGSATFALSTIRDASARRTDETKGKAEAAPMQAA